ncbi:MAG: flagellar biosynthesis protein FlhB [Desulfovibrio sp.]
MAFGQSDPSKTEKATPKRREKSRNKGDVPKGQEMGKTIVLLAGVIAIKYTIGFYYQELSMLYRWFFTEGMSFEVNKQTVYDLFLWNMKEISLMMLPLLALITFAAFVTMRVQVGQLWTLAPMKPKFGKIFNVIAGLKKVMLSADSIIRLLKSIFMACVLAIAPYIVIRQELPNLIPLFYKTPEGIAIYILEVAYKMVTYALFPMVVIAIADLIYTRWNFEEQLKMTKDEVKDENKNALGDPEIKAKQQEKMMQVMARRMMQDVPKADVVVTNPTHFAVAIRYDKVMAPAPQVLAKGVDRVAEKIKEIARENNIEIRQDKPLARALYKQVEIGDVIPEELYQAVAAILAQLNQFKS